MLAVFAAVFASMAVGYLIQGAFAGAEFPFVTNSVAKDGLFCALCLAAANDLRRFSWAVSVVIGGHVLLVGGLLFMLAFGDISKVGGSFDGPLLPDGETLFWIWLGLAVAVTALFIWLQRRANRSRYQLRYLSQSQHRTVMALAEVLVGGEGAALTPEQVAANVDDYLYSFAAKAKWKFRLALTACMLYPLLRLRPPLPVMSPERRRVFVERSFFRDVVERRLPGFLRRALQTMMFAAQQLVFIGYYARPAHRRNDRLRAVLGASRLRGGDEAGRPPERPRVDATTPREIDGESITADVVIVGSGAAGAVIAHRLAELGREVVVLERGRHVDPSEFTEDERTQFSNLYADGALQLSKDARFQVLQGMCVGGTTVVNNAVCFDLPDDSLSRWNDPRRPRRRARRERVRARRSRRLRGMAAGAARRRTARRCSRARAGSPQGVTSSAWTASRTSSTWSTRTSSAAWAAATATTAARTGRSCRCSTPPLPWAQKRHGTDAVRVIAECDAPADLRDGRRATGVEAGCRTAASCA